jgi:alcohol dehydrogenase (cytochrome c)
MKRLLLVLLGLALVPGWLWAQIPKDADIRAILSESYVSDDMLLNADKDANNWLHYGRDYATTRYSPLTQVNRGTVKDLVAKWSFSFGVLEGQDSQAVAHNGEIFVTTSFNRVFKLDGRSGKVMWSYIRNLPSDVYPYLCCDVVNRGVALYHDKAYLGTLDAHVVALNRQNGEVVWDTTTEDYKSAFSLTVMPMALRGKIIVGTAGAEYGVRGWIMALDADTGKQVWKTYTIAGPDGPIMAATGKPYPDWQKQWGGDSWKTGGGSGWVTGAYDAELNNLYWPVGNPGPDFNGAARPGDNLFSNTTLVMDPDTGHVKFWFQYTPHDNWDYDGVNEVVLADVAGKKVWLHGDRNGHVYSIDRTNGKCVWVKALAQINWVKSWGDNCRPIVDPRYDPEANGFDKVTTNIHPSLDGGKEWHPVAYSPKTKMVYVPSYNFGMDLQPLNQKWERGQWYLGAQVIRITDGNGALRAHDAATGELKWQNIHRTPMTSGVLATAGGLVFYGDPEGVFHGANDETGEELWSFQTGTGIHGNPTTFTVDGEQRVAVVVGPGGGGLWPLHYGKWLKNNTKGGALFVFGLHGK